MNPRSTFHYFIAFFITFAYFPQQAHAQCDPRRDSLALVALFDATGGNNWTIKTNWKVVGQPIGTWYGITTDAGGCVTCIDLDGVLDCRFDGGGNGNNLVGIIPTILDSLKKLNGLYLAGNKLSGNIPNLNFPSLQYLTIARNQLSGAIPNFNLPNLKVLTLTSNQLSGVIPNFNLPLLEHLYLLDNKLNGNIPNFNLPNLQYLQLHNNQLEGSIPIFNLPKLITLYLFANKLTGNIPNFDLPNLQQLQLNNNQLTGNIPNFNLPNLQGLYLYSNQLTDTIPNFTMPNLENLNIALNQLTGNIPKFNMPKLQFLFLTNNLISGTIPIEIGQLSNLTTLALNQCKLTGSVPMELNNLRKLSYLGLGNNNLSGIFPKLTNPLLESFGISGNKIDSLPNLSAIPFIQGNPNQINGFSCGMNRLSFDDIVPNLRIRDSVQDFTYAPQDSIFKDTAYNRTINDPLSINLNIDDTVTTNIYKWYKNNVLYRTITGFNKLVFNTLQATDAGVYRCEVTNPNAPLLTLYSRKATLKVLQTPPPTLTLFKDSLVLVFMDNVLATSVNSTNIKVHGLETGFRTGTFTVQGAKVVFRPTTPFNTGEEIMVTVKSVFTASGSALSNSVIKKHIPVTVRSNPNFISPQYTGLQTAATHDGGYVLAADFNRDGRVDLIQTSGFYGLDIPYTIQLQNADGSFTTSQTITSNKYSGVGSLADLNNDGYPDITIFTNAPSEYKVYLNDRTGRFSTGISYNLPPFNDALTYGDVDGDGDIDIVSSAGLAGGTNYIGVAKNNGNGTFQAVIQYSMDPTFGTQVHLNDMDNDGDLDIVLQGSNSFGKTPLIILFENDGLGNFLRGQQYGPVNSGAGAIRDFNNDGKLDLLTTTDSLRLFLGNGNMTLQTPFTSIDKTILPYISLFGDFNGDNNMDFTVIPYNTTFKPLRLYENNGTGNFSIQQLCLTVDGGASVSDINNDGKLDIAYWSVGSKKTFVAYQMPTIDSLKQDSICMGKTYRLPTGRIVSVAGTYLDTFRSNIGCDSIRFMTNLKVIPLEIPINRTICSNDSIQINSKWYSQRRPSGRDTLKTAGSCDSVFIVNLSFKTPTDAIDDNVIVTETNATEFTVTDNDRYETGAQLTVTLLKKPQYGTLATLGNGKFRYESMPILRGVTQFIKYQLCNTLCPNECDSAQVTIDIQGISPVQKASKGITPQNQDGKNDVLEFDETEDVTRYPESELIIYNRWNDIVFRAKPYLNNWDGNRNGQPLPAGTYYYILHLNQKEGKTLTGDVTIIR